MIFKTSQIPRASLHPEGWRSVRFWVLEDFLASQNVKKFLKSLISLLNIKSHYDLFNNLAKLAFLKYYYNLTL